MAKYNVMGSVPVFITIEVEADSAEGAIEVAYNEFECLSGYCGNGGIDKLVGTTQQEVSLDAGYSDPEFTEAELAE